MKTLSLTSPYMHGPDCERMQKAMVKKGWLQGATDGVYGPLSAQAAYRSKFWLGYAKPDQTAGDVLLAYLEGRKQPTEAMAKLAAERKKQAPAVPVRQKALNWLSAKIGEKEHPPESNRVSWASEWYGLIGPWCAMAVTRAYVEAGSKAFVKGSRFAYCPYIVNDAHAGANGLAITTNPQPGDLVLFDWGGDGVADHVGLFVKWIDKARTQAECVEANTSASTAGSQSNGGMVARRNRSKSDVRAFVHVGK